jgi:CubicO group peptidase (beta-lactamase class C family)
MVEATAVRNAIEAEPEEVEISTSRLQNLSLAVQRHIEAGHIPGAITVVARRGKVVHFQTYGSMDDEAGKPMRPDAIFRIYSMTKPIVSLALMQLYEDGHFQLDDPASRYIPELKGLKVIGDGTVERFATREPSREPTVRDMLTHMGGLSSPAIGARPPGMPVSLISQLYEREAVPGIGHDGTLHDTMVKLGRLPLQADPGTQWIYGVSTDVVGYLCEVLSGMPLDRFLEERIFQPLGMTDTSFYVPPEKLDRFCACYRPDVATGRYALQDAPATSPFARQGTYFSGVGGLQSTAHDYIRFAKMLANGGDLDGVRIIGKRTLEFMTTNHLPGGVDRADISQSIVPGMPQQRGTGFGLGFSVLLNPAEAQVLGTPGEFTWSGAASTHFFVSPRDELAVVFMTQLFGFGPVMSVSRDIRVATYQALRD